MNFKNMNIKDGKPVNNDKMKLVFDDLNILVKKHNLKFASFCAVEKTHDKPLAFTAFDVNTYEDYLSSVLLVGKLWQVAREDASKIFNMYEENNHDQK